MWHVERDYATAEPSSLAITRTYNSSRLRVKGAPSTAFGHGWSHPYDISLRRIVPFTATEPYMKCWKQMDTSKIWCNSRTPTETPIPEAIAVTRGDGKEYIFNRGANNLWQSRAYVNDFVAGIPTADGATIKEWLYADQQRGTTERFDSNGRLLSITTLTGRVTRMTYSTAATNDSSVERYPAEAPACSSVQAGALVGAGRLMCVTDHWGRQLQFEYDALGRITKAIDPAMQAYVYAYDGVSGGCTTNTGNNMFACSANNLTSVTYPDAKSRIYHYGEKDRIVAGGHYVQPSCGVLVSTDTGFVSLVNVLTGLTDENAKRYINWTYDCNGMARSSSKAGGVERVDIESTLRTLPAARAPMSSTGEVMDVYTVTSTSDFRGSIQALMFFVPNAAATRHAHTM